MSPEVNPQTKTLLVIRFSNQCHYSASIRFFYRIRRRSRQLWLRWPGQHCIRLKNLHLYRILNKVTGRCYFALHFLNSNTNNHQQHHQLKSLRSLNKMHKQSYKVKYKQNSALPEPASARANSQSLFRSSSLGKNILKGTLLIFFNMKTLVNAFIHVSIVVLFHFFFFFCVQLFTACFCFPVRTFIRSFFRLCSQRKHCIVNKTVQV